MRGGKIILAIVALLYLSIELLVYVLVCMHIIKPDPTFAAYKTLYASNKAYVERTSYGYRYMPGKVSLVNISDGEINTMHTMSVNNYGYPSHYNFNREKATNVYRYLVFGDSYSAAEITDTTWVDFLQEMYLQHPGNI
jgi:hypothetical protein